MVSPDIDSMDMLELDFNVTAPDALTLSTPSSVAILASNSASFCVVGSVEIGAMGLRGPSVAMRLSGMGGTTNREYTGRLRAKQTARRHRRLQ